MKNSVRKMSKAVLFALILFHSCIDTSKKNNIDPEPKSKASVTREGTRIIDISSDQCKEIFGYVIPPDGLILSATDIDNGYGMNFIINYNDINDLSVGRTFSTSSDNTPSFLATVGQVSSSKSWHSDLEHNNGSLTITAFDPNTGLASCEFSFVGYVLDRNTGEFTSESARFSGSMTNVRVYPNSDAWLDCEHSTPGLGTNPNNPNSGNSSLTFENQTYTDISITLGGVTQDIGTGQKVTFQGKSGSKTSFVAITSGKTSSGGIVGLEMHWDSPVTFPPSGTSNVPLSISKDYFFVKVVNNSIRKINKVSVNYQLQSGVAENLTIPNDGQTYWLGYYKAFSNSNVRLENTDANWSWQYNSTDIKLPFTVNQSVTLNAN